MLDKVKVNRNRKKRKEQGEYPASTGFIIGQEHFIPEIKVGNTEWKGIQHHQPKTIKANLENIHHLF